MNNHEYVASKLKEIIDEKGPDSLLSDPYKMYEIILKDKKIDNKIALSLLCFFAKKTRNELDMPQPIEKLSNLIRNDLGYNKETADDLSKILNILYCPENKNVWEERKLIGLIAFQQENFKCKWSKYEEWDAGGTVLGLKYCADIELKPLKKISNEENIKKMIKKNPFIGKNEIYDYFKEKISDYLDDEFSEFCQIDDYYPPCIEEFIVEDYLEKWCKENGFKLIKCEGEGEDLGYEPKYRGYY